MNAPGIVVMYGAFDRDTALAETTGVHNEFSVAELRLLKDLRVVDLTRVPPVPSIFEDGPRESLLFLRHFAKDVSQPFTPDVELHIEYTPTQVVSEYLRHRLRDKTGATNSWPALQKG
jgi:RES domain